MSRDSTCVEQDELFARTAKQANKPTRSTERRCTNLPVIGMEMKSRFGFEPIDCRPTQEELPTRIRRFAGPPLQCHLLQRYLHRNRVVDSISRNRDKVDVVDPSHHDARWRRL